MTENTYGLEKRLDFISRLISEIKPSRVLDMGCGTGENLTSLLATQFPHIHFVGMDADTASIQWATQHNKSSNLRFVDSNIQEDPGQFELVVASEVIEHVENPREFLKFIRNLLSPNGRVVLTLPNGFGPFEIVSFIETLMHISGLYRVLRRLKQLIRPSQSHLTMDTLAVSPHINFFSYARIRSLIANSGFEIVEYRPRTFLCGFLFDQLIQSPGAILWNRNISEALPPNLVSAWMFLLMPVQEPAFEVDYSRGRLASFRRYLNEKRWGLK